MKTHSPKFEPGATVGGLRHVDAPVVASSDRADDIEAETGTTRLRRIPRFEDSLPFVVGNPRSIVRNEKSGFVVETTDCDCTVRSGMLASVPEQILKQLLKPVFVGRYRRLCSHTDIHLPRIDGIPGSASN